MDYATDLVDMIQPPQPSDAAPEDARPLRITIHPQRVGGELPLSEPVPDQRRLTAQPEIVGQRDLSDPKPIRLVPVEHTPEFHHELVPVDYDPFAGAPPVPDDPFERAATTLRNQVGHGYRHEGTATKVLEGIGDDVYRTATLPPRMVDAVMREDAERRGVVPMSTDNPTAADVGGEATTAALMNMLGPAPQNHSVGVFGGRLAKGADLTKLARAEEIEKLGHNPSTIRDITGWFRGADNQWRFEIPDTDARWLGENAIAAKKQMLAERAASLLQERDKIYDVVSGQTSDPQRFAQINREVNELYRQIDAPPSMADHLHHPKLYEQYPHVGEMRTDVLDLGGISGTHFTPNDALKGRVELDTTKGTNRLTALHEIQHEVQDTEGFARGAGYSTPEVAAEAEAQVGKRRSDLLKELEQINRAKMQYLKMTWGYTGPEDVKNAKYMQMADSYWNSHPDEAARLIEINASTQQLNAAHQRALHAAYKRVAGEVESRLVESRAGMTPRELATKEPWKGEDIPRDQQIVIRREGNTASTGHVTETPEFKNWFGDSKVVDAGGAPLRVYHGTRSDFSTFDPAKTGSSTDGGWFGEGIYLTPSPEEASNYAQISSRSGSTDRKAQGAVVPVYVKAENPYVTDLQSLSPSFIEKLKAEGHDAIFRVDYPSDAIPKEIVVFKPEQVKSATGNSGKFDPKNPDIRASVDDPGAPARVNEGLHEFPEPDRNVGHEAGPEQRHEAAAEPARAPGPEGGPGGSGGLAEAQRAAEAARGSAVPLEGLPQKPIEIEPGVIYVPGPIQRVQDIAADYMRGTGREYKPITSYREVQAPRAKRIAEQFEKMKHAPDDPAVKASYDAMIDETVEQLKAIQKSGIKIEFIKPDMVDPYAASPRKAIMDVRDNNHLWVYPTDAGFGTADSAGAAAAMKDNPLLRRTGIKIDGLDLTANDAFRIVHDFFGHIKDGVGFRAGGEENAWRSHSRMYSPLARKAMTSETRGQNSWLNYGPHGDKNRTAKSADTIYADQKIGLMPNWTHLDGAADHYVAPPMVDSRGHSSVNAGVDAPTNKSVQTVADPHRMMFPGIYENPRKIASEAAERVAPESIDMKRLWGVSRGDLDEMAKGRVGNEEPKVFKGPGVAKGALSAQNIQTPQNTQRVIDVLAEAGKYPGLKHADAWYILDPVYQRMEQLFGPEEAKVRFDKLNTMMGMASPGSEVMTEIQRGTAAHHMASEGRFDEFLKHAGTPKEWRKGPKELNHVEAHPYHRTAQAEPMLKYLETGSIQSKEPKVPAYVHASGTPETGFQTSGPVGDAHFARGVGLSDTRKGPSEVAGSISRPEYHTLQPWWKDEVAGELGMESVPAQARLWTAMGPRTGVSSQLGQGKLELLTAQIMKAAKRLRITPEAARDLILSGKAGAGAVGAGVVGAAAQKSGGPSDALLDYVE